jgi:peptidoglycan LD-endopeptidase LytH
MWQRMNWKNIDPFPLMGEWLTPENSIALDLSVNNGSLNKSIYGNLDAFHAYIESQLKDANVFYGHGGYFENRIVYNVFDNFATSDEHRSIHLGIDVWSDAGKPVYAPIEGRIHSYQINEGAGNYGPTIILEHKMEGAQLYSLYGHLKTTDLDELFVGKIIPKGTLLCHLGETHENGQWPPHLHFQLMYDMEGWKGDYPGVCSKKDRMHYAQNCPDPAAFIFSKLS